MIREEIECDSKLLKCKAYEAYKPKLNSMESLTIEDALTVSKIRKK